MSTTGEARRRAEIEAKRTKLAELRRAREERSSRLQAGRAGDGGKSVSEVCVALRRVWDHVYGGRDGEDGQAKRRRAGVRCFMLTKRETRLTFALDRPPHRLLARTSMTSSRISWVAAAQQAPAEVDAAGRPHRRRLSQRSWASEGPTAASMLRRVLRQDRASMLRQTAVALALPVQAQ